MRYFLKSFMGILLIYGCYSFAANQYLMLCSKIMKWDEYNPEWLAKLAEEQVPEETWLPSALRQCTRYSIGSKAYYHFVSPENANNPGAEWQFERSIVLEDPKEGELVLDILKGNRVGGIEFLLLT